jgi:hypothetical protein
VLALHVDEAMHLDNRVPAVCGTLDAEKLLDFANVTLVSRAGPKNSTTARWTFAL